MLAWLPFFTALLLGSVPFGLLIARSQGINLRKHGSGNIGATNVWRTLGKKAGLSCFLLDFAKGFLPVLFAVLFVPTLESSLRIWIQLATAFGAILGHNFSPWVGFRGGKGVATSAGAFAALAPAALVTALIVWLMVLQWGRMVSLASMIAACALPLAYTLYSNFLPTGTPLKHEFNWPVLLLLCLAAVLVILRHKSNIGRILKGTEAKIGQAKQNNSSN